MTHTLFYEDNTLVVPNRVAAYDPGQEGNFLVDWSTSYDIVGGGGLMSSVDDLLSWDRNFYANKLGKGTLPVELQSHGVLNNGDQIDYARAYRLAITAVFRSSSTTALFSGTTAFLRFPQERFSVIVLCNLATAGPEALARKIADLYLAPDFKPTKNTVTTASDLPDPSAFAGTYLDPHTKTLYTFTADHGNLMAWGAVLRRIDANRFYDLGSNVITFEKVSGTMRCSLAIPGEVYFSGEKLEPVHLSEADLARFAGRYHSDELERDLHVVSRKGRLTVKEGDKPPVIFDPATHDEFYSSDFRTLVYSPTLTGASPASACLHKRPAGSCSIGCAGSLC